MALKSFERFRLFGFGAMQCIFLLSVGDLPPSFSQLKRKMGPFGFRRISGCAFLSSGS